MKDHIHDCTGPDASCACGYVFRVPPVSVSIDITEGHTALIDEAFSCDSLAMAVRALRRAADLLERV